MGKLNLKLLSSLAKRLRIISKYAQQDAGFSLLEVLVVVIMIGVLSAIAAPGWLAFLNRQRINKANDTVLAALQEAQRQAKKTKLSYSVSFKTQDNVPQIAIHPSNSDPSWRNLGEDVGIKPTEVLLGTNISAKNTVGTLTYAAAYDTENPQTITFDYMGSLPDATFGTPSNGSTEQPGIKIVVAVPQPGSNTEPSGTRRCVIVQNLIGGMRTAKDSDCN